jgi:chromosome segregation ATPase
MTDTYCVNRTSNFQEHGFLGLYKTKEELRNSVDILTESLTTERKLNQDLTKKVQELESKLLNSELNLKGTEFSLQVNKEGMEEYKKQIIELKAELERARYRTETIRLNFENTAKILRELEYENRRLINALENVDEDNQF